MFFFFLWASMFPLRTLNLAVCALSIVFLFFLFVIYMPQNRPIIPFLPPFDHFYFRPTLGLENKIFGTNGFTMVLVWKTSSYNGYTVAFVWKTIGPDGFPMVSHGS